MSEYIFKKYPTNFFPYSEIPYKPFWLQICIDAEVIILLGNIYFPDEPFEFSIIEGVSELVLLHFHLVAEVLGQLLKQELLKSILTYPDLEYDQTCLEIASDLGINPLPQPSTLEFFMHKLLFLPFLKEENGIITALIQ